MNTENLVRKAQGGNREALEGLILSIQDDVYKLAMRMLCNPEDARDATQEIIINIMTKLSTFQFKSAFKTWAYRVAVNYLLNTKKILSADPGLSFDIFQQDLESDLEDAGKLRDLPEYPLLLNEIRIACTMAMLLCLDHKHRVVYILGEIFELDSKEASEVLGLSNENYRKQLSRARSKVLEFTNKACGLVSECAKCTCETKLKGAIRRGRVNHSNQYLAMQSSVSYAEVQRTIQNIDKAERELRTKTLQCSVPEFVNTEDFSRIVAAILD